MSPQTGSQPRRITRTGSAHSALEREKALAQTAFSKSVHTMMRGFGEIKDMGDAAAAVNDRYVTLMIAHMTSDQLRRMHERQMRINNGEITSGVCENENCGARIPEVRMKAIPWATRCTACEELKEQQIA